MLRYSYLRAAQPHSYSYMLRTGPRTLANNPNTFIRIPRRCYRQSPLHTKHPRVRPPPLHYHQSAFRRGLSLGGHNQSLSRHPHIHLRASYGPYIFILAVACGAVLVYDSAYPGSYKEPESTKESVSAEPIPLDGYSDIDTDAGVSPYDSLLANMAIPQGQRGNLTAEQEAKLRDFWAVTLKTFGVEDPSHATAATNDNLDASSEIDSLSTPSGKGSEDKKKKRMSIFRKHKDSPSSPSLPHESGTTTPTKDPSKSTDSDDKYGQVKEYHDILATSTPESLRATFWSMVKADHPDALLLRFLRARKWDIDRALVMLISTMKWRAAEMHVDDDVMYHGDGGALEDSKDSSNAAVKKEGDDFLTQLRMGKSFLHGVDKEGRPLCVVRARLHRSGEQSEKSLERYTVYVIETARLVLRSPVETAVSVKLISPIAIYTSTHIFNHLPQTPSPSCHR